MEKPWNETCELSGIGSFSVYAGYADVYAPTHPLSFMGFMYIDGWQIEAQASG